MTIDGNATHVVSTTLLVLEDDGAVMDIVRNGANRLWHVRYRLEQSDDEENSDR